MNRIIGIAGKKQSGKNTAANCLHGLSLKKRGLIRDFEIGPKGSLSVLTEDGWGVFDVTRRDDDFVSYADANMWPHIKLYSFADPLKGLCLDFFGLKPEQVYGTDKEKNTSTQIMWEDIPTWKNTSLNLNRGFMTARELLQYFGTNIMRRMHKDVWVNHTINKIKSEKTELAVIADVRFPNEVDSILEVGGEIIRLNRKPLTDNHESETALDEGNFEQSKFSHIIPSGSIEDLCTALETIFLKGSTC
jgi:hypothetical protein